MKFKSKIKSEDDPLAQRVKLSTPNICRGSGSCTEDEAHEQN